MASRSVNWPSNQFLPCACRAGVPIIVGLPADLVVVPECSESGTHIALHHILATLVTYRPLSCNSTCKYLYEISYDSDDVTRTLVAEDITGVVCEGTLTDFINDRAGQAITASYDLGSRTLTITDQYGCVTELVLEVP